MSGWSCLSDESDVVGVVCAVWLMRVLVVVSDEPILQRPLAGESEDSVYIHKTYKV